MTPAADNVVHVLTLPLDQVARRPDLQAALFAWKRPNRTAVFGLAVGERVRFALAPGAWRFGRVVAWEPWDDRAPAMAMARVALERRADGDPAEVRRMRANLMPVPEPTPESAPETAHAAP